MFPTSACCVLSYVQLFVTLWTVALQAPLPMEFSRQEYSSGLPFPTPRKLPHPGIQPGSPAIAGGFFTTEPPGKPIYHCQDYSLNNWLGISLVVHWLKLCASTAGSVGLITGPGTKIPKATWSGKTTVLIMSLFKKASVTPYYPHPLCLSWRRERLPSPVFWPGEFHGLYALWGHRVKHDWMTFTLLVPIKILPILQGVAQVAMPVLTQGFTTLAGNIFSLCCYPIAQR